VSETQIVSKKIKSEFVLSKFTQELFRDAADGNIDNIINTCILNEKQTNVNCYSNTGQTPLMWAAMSGKIEAMKYLMAMGAKLYTMDVDGLTALDHLYLNGYSKYEQNIVNTYDYIHRNGVELIPSASPFCNVSSIKEHFDNMFNDMFLCEE